MLPIRRLLNLLWHWVSRDADGDRRAMLLDALDTATDAYALDVVPRPRAAAAATAPAPMRGRAAIPGTSTHGIRPPSWWRGDRNAWRTTVRAADQLGEPAAKKARTPTVGSRG